jgi:hypothetical protein
MLRRTPEQHSMGTEKKNARVGGKELERYENWFY